MIIVKLKDIDNKGNFLKHTCPSCGSERLIMKDFDIFHFDFEMECERCRNSETGTIDSLDHEEVEELIRERINPFDKIQGRGRF